MFFGVGHEQGLNMDEEIEEDEIPLLSLICECCFIQFEELCSQVYCPYCRENSWCKK